VAVSATGEWSPETKRLIVNKITWSQVGRVTDPGQYTFGFGSLAITAEDIAVWEQFPDAVFTLVERAKASAAGEFRLGAFDLR